MSVPNRQWKWVIIDLEQCDICGTDDDKVANEFAQAESYFVIERNTCQVLDGTTGLTTEQATLSNIPEQELYKF